MNGRRLVLVTEVAEQDSLLETYFILIHHEPAAHVSNFDAGSDHRLAA